GEILSDEDELYVGAATHYAVGPEVMEQALKTIQTELDERLAELEHQGKLLEAQRLRMRTTYDMEMMQQVGTCSGIENYSRHMDQRPAGSAPHCLLDYFPDDFLLVVDESHVTVPQIGAMYEGDMSRKRTLVEHGFRLPSAMDNRPLTWNEFAARIGQTIYLSATPGPYEMERTGGEFVEQIISLKPGCAPDICTARSTRSDVSNFSANYVWANSMSWWASICCAKAWTYPKSVSWPFWMPIKKAFCGQAGRSSKPSAGRRAM